MKDNTYNGWTNYETWVVKLWTDNEESTQSYWNERAQEQIKNPDSASNDFNGWTKEQAARYSLEQKIKAYFEDENPLGDDASMWSDLMTAALDSVNWREIAEALITDNLAEVQEESED